VGHFIAKPSTQLAGYVKQYWAVEDIVPSGLQHLQRIVPNGLPELTFYLGNTPESLDSRQRYRGNLVLCGQHNAFHDIVITGEISLFSISFRPYALKILFGIPANELNNINVSLFDICGNEAYILEFKLAESRSFFEKIKVTEQFLLKRLNLNFSKNNIQRIADSLTIIDKSYGSADIGLLASKAFLSRKQYERMFAEYVGASPGQFLRTVRFQHSLHIKHCKKNIPLTELAYLCGYYDQSHMIHEYKLLSGLTPSQYFAECEPVSDYFQEFP